MSDQLPAARPIPATILEVSDPNLRQRAIDVYRSASLLRDLIDRQRRWFHQLKADRSTDPGPAIRLGWEIGACVRALASFGIFPSASEASLLFPESPSGELASKGLTEEQVDQIETELRTKVPEKYKHDIPNWWDDDTYILSSIVKLANLHSLQGYLEGLCRMVELAPSVALDPPVIIVKPLAGPPSPRKAVPPDGTTTSAPADPPTAPVPFGTAAPSVPPEGEQTRPSADPDPVPKDDVEPVRLDGPDDPVFVWGEEKDPLPLAEFRVIKALVEARAKRQRLSADRLRTATKDGDGNLVEDPVGALKRLRKRDDDWMAVIDMAGDPGRGYGLKDKRPRPTRKNPETHPRRPRGGRK
jgi:hypothetical protein